MTTSPARVAEAAAYIRTVLVLPDSNAATLFRHLGRALSAADPTLPDPNDPRIVYHTLRDPALPYKPEPYLSALVPIIRLLERDDAPSSSSDSIHEWLLGGGISAPLTLVTKKARLFNYISAQAIKAALGVTVDVRDRNDVSLLTAQALYAKQNGAWGQLAVEARREMIAGAESLLSEVVGPILTVDSLRERHAKADVGHWLSALKWALPRRTYD